LYLKSLEMIGFKSFAAKTKLDFEPGLTAIVGPNGCGKSNIADAFRWVLGEQSAKALRGAKMEDCIFNGTDTRKPLGMAEVSVTFTDCESALGTEYHEVTITRRVFRSGEGQYFINKTPCRLKDIQRLFMDTGIGTDSYSLMEQGRIDQVLSAHPEDRRTIFEEASGITKYKADKKEALRKLEQTEANLLRLADVIREVKRQIGSLQRQAGKARRYQEIRDELRRLDVFSTRRRLESAAALIAGMERDAAALGARLAEAHAELEEMERGNAVLRESLMQTEREIGAVLEAGMQARGRLDHARELIQVNRQRIEEYRGLSERDSREIEQAQTLLAERRAALAEHERQNAAAAAERQRAAAAQAASSRALEEHRGRMEALRAEIQKRRAEALDLEGLLFRLQNELVEHEARERNTVLQRERLAAEQSQLARLTAAYDKRQGALTAELAALRHAAEESRQALSEQERRREELARRLAELQQQSAEDEQRLAAGRARLELLGDAAETQSDFPAGARRLLDAAAPLPAERREILGALVSFLDAAPEDALALEAALRPWLDALVIGTARGAFDILRQLAAEQAGAARLLAADGPAAPPPAPPAPGLGARLADRLRCPESLRPLVERLLGHVWIVERLEDLPWPLPAGAVCVTRGGALARADGVMELWSREAQAANPFARKQSLAQTRAECAALEAALDRRRAAAAAAQRAAAEAETAIRAARAGLEAAQQAYSEKEGEVRVVNAEAAETRRRLETVTWELENLTAQSSEGDSQRRQIVVQMDELRAQRERLTQDIQSQTVALHDLETEHAQRQAQATEDRIRLAAATQTVEHLSAQQTALRANLAELEASLQSRAAGVQSYAQSIARLQEAIAEAESRLSAMQNAVAENETRVENLRKNRGRQAEELKEMEQALARKRAAAEALREERSALELRLSEARLRRQNQLDRIAADYHLSPEQILEQPEPDWGADGPPTLETIETRVAELRTKLEAMGPVNLVAIEEYKELEERHAFLTGQEQDLVNSRAQLMEMIRKINRTTSEMFRDTFQKVNEKFQYMFERLFNGGTAKLVLVNEEDVLECGIEIIARPPGKRLQNVSLLSGGERTLTAVALLFAIYLIKPSPFCMLDELDAALDESNIGRFVGVLQEFLKQSQFVVITHNRQTIAAADILYGVTMPEKGVSNVVSMRFMGHERPPAAPAAPSAAARQPADAPAEAVAAAPPAGLQMQVRG